ncbi:MAG: GspE/PulE family protein [Candidatus Gracilibacteria bacterium]|nr:GspE/PulE family protein [Candidatus Gracilibacteria bacterium]
MSKINDLIGNFKKKSQNKDINNSSKSQVDDLFDVGGVSSDGLKKSHLSITQASKEDDENIIGFVNDLFIISIQKKASDIHIEPNDKNIRIRLRIDGNFVSYKTLELKKAISLIARIKIMAYLRIDEQRLPQDGKINFNLFGGKSIDLRVSILPNIYGEKCVIRILNKEEKPPELVDLGMLPYNMIKIKKHLLDSHGMILAVGPTGSGKSTTLFSLLSNFDAEKNNISTLEDPVEYRIPGVNHTQINPSIGFSFAEGLRSILRQDPDIIMVGEIRDEETAKLAVESSITGHLVFSTLHTNSAVHTLSRLVNLGIDPLLLSSSLRLVISQRLVRKLCPNCKESYLADEKVKDVLVGKVGRYIKNKDEIKLYGACENGCEKCNHTGYKGRIGIFEVLEMNEKIEDLLINKASKTQIEIQAIGDGMVPILQDAFLKVILGDTSIQEVLSAIGSS